VASKNDREVVEKALQRSDILLRQERIFPIEVHWQAKSGSVSRILQAWNISADAVVFIDDNPAELAEVAAAHPGIECVQFPAKDYAAAFNLLQRLRDLCGKRYITQEDSVRLESIRRSAEVQSGERTETSEDFLRHADAVVTFEDGLSEVASRPLELVNKTNQFNLNGIRYTESEWRAETSAPGCCFLVADYKDRFGMLGKVAVILGHLDGETLRIRVWVMSCRAFSRRIEYLCLHNLFARYPIRQMEFEVLTTEKNGPFRTLMQSLVGECPNGPYVLTRERFYEVCPPLYQTVAGSLTPNGANEGPLNKVF
jgi:FkbH-like protein